jgi:hypothetical protein
MAHYRAYVIGSDGHFHAAHDLDSEDDVAAIEAARQYVNGSDVEVWQASRRLIRLDHKQE